MSEWRHTVSLNFTDGFRKTIWNLGKSLEVMLTAGKAWHMAGPHSSIRTLCPQSVICEYECLCKGSKSPLIHTPGVVQPWSTLPGMLKNKFPRVILLHDIASWRNLNWSSSLNEGEVWNLHEWPWNFDMWQLQWMLSQEPWKNTPCGGRVPLVTTWNYIDVTASQRRDHEKQD